MTPPAAPAALPPTGGRQQRPGKAGSALAWLRNLSAAVTPSSTRAVRVWRF
jgi:hypothetical protein